jgi:hypothetical protein
MKTTAAPSTRPQALGRALQSTTRFSPEEIEAHEIAYDGRRHSVAGGYGGDRVALPGDAHAAVIDVMVEPGDRLPEAARRTAENEMRSDFSRVVVHTGPRAAAAARAVHAKAFTVGDHIVFGSRGFSSGSPGGAGLLRHELAHVAQQSRSGQIALARELEDDPDANVSLGVLDDRLANIAGEQVLGETAWTVAREFIRGLWGGLKSVGADQWAKIEDKFSDIGIGDIVDYAEGYFVGILSGLWSALVGLLEAIWTLIKLPFQVAEFMLVTLPELTAKYASRIAQLAADPTGIRMQLNLLLANPRETYEQLRGLADEMKKMALAKVRALGRSAARKAIAFIGEPWYEFGHDVGQVVGQILFEVLLALVSSGIGNALKTATEIAGKIAARAVTSVVEILSSAGRLIGQALEWLGSLGRKLSGKAGELFEAFKTLLNKLRALLAEMGAESAVAETGAGGVRVPIPEPKGAGTLESRALPPKRTSPATVADLTPPKVHPSKVGVADQPKLPPVKKLPPGPEPPGQITAQPKGTQELPGGTHQVIDKPKGAPPLESQVQGKIGEARAGIDPRVPKRAIRVDGRLRIPEKIDDVNKLLREVKNVKNLGDEAAELPQLLDYAKWAKDNGYTFELVIDNSTTVGSILKGLENSKRVVIIRMALR